MTSKAEPRVLVLLTEPKSPRPKTWEPREKLPPRKVDSVTRARMVLEHPGFSGAAA